MAGTVKQVLENMIASVILYLPVSWCSDIGAFFGRIAIYKAERAQKPWVRRFYKNAKRLCNAKTVEQQHRCLVEYGCQRGRLYAEYTILQKLYRKGHVRISGEDNLVGITTPAIFVVPHIANWELIVKVISELNNPTCGLYEPRESPARMKIANKARLQWGKNISIISTDAAFVARKLSRKLSQNTNIWIMTDESSSGYVWAPSLGRKLPYGGNRWLASKLAVKHDIDIIPMHVERTDNINFTVHIGEKLSVSETGDKKEKAKALADQIDDLFNQWVLKKPEHWFYLPELDFDRQSQDFRQA